MAGGDLQEGQQFRVAKAPQADAGYRWFEMERRQQVGQWMPRADVRLSEGANHNCRHGLVGTDHVTQELQGRHIGPLQVVEHEHDRDDTPGRLENAEDRSEEQVAGRLGIGRPASTRLA